MKKLFSFILSASIAASMAIPALADMQISQTVPEVYVNDRKITFKGQSPILDTSVDRVMVPLRGVMEAMGAEVIWQEETRSVIINSKDNITRLVLEIGNPEMKIYTAVSLMKYDESTYTLDAAPVIMNNRTLFPLRAISENMAADVQWNNDTHTADIHTKEYLKYINKQTEENKGDNEDYSHVLKDNVINLSLSSDSKDIKQGDQVEIYVNMTNTNNYADYKLNAITSTLFYDKEKFSFDKAEVMLNDKVFTDVLAASNGDYPGNSVKSVAIIMPNTTEERGVKDSKIMKFTFTSLTGEAGEFSLADRIAIRGYDNELNVEKDSKSYSFADYQNLYLDTTPLIIK